MKNGHYFTEENDEVWVQNGKLHRLDGPAVIYSSGYHVWYQNGRKHREDGPATQFNITDFEYWLDGEYYPQIKNDVLWRIEVQKIKRKQKGDQWN